MKNSKNPIVSYFSSAFEEFGKVTWPTKEQAALLTGIVVGVSLVVGVYIALLDLGFSEGYKVLLEKAPVQQEDSSFSVDAGDITATPVPSDSTDTSSTPSQ